ncbi:MAG: hypothetical protein CVU43_05775 [Chloroflexi bacterium HGW-Chloroflexi-5]|jgi:hypothetical protein|nr:MAG: hypothetical protein CVU43_05775 [Chloroflexi bacterium HGW-Chloroflexi-5]
MSELDKNELIKLFKSCDFDNPDSFRLFSEQLQELVGVNFWQSEAKKAFGERDQAKHKVKNLTNIMNEKFQQLKQSKNRSAADSKLLEYEIAKSAKALRAYSTSQVHQLLKDRFEQDTDGSFYQPVCDENGNTISKKSVADTVKEFLNDPSNDNLVEADVRGGSGHSTVTLTASGKANRRVSKSAKRKSSDRKKYSAEVLKGAEQHGFSPSDWSEILQQKEEILAKKKGKN